VGISVGASIMQQCLRIYLRQSLTDYADFDSIVKHVRESLDYIDTLDPAVGEVVRRCYSKALGVTFVLNLCLAAVSAFTSWFIKDKDLS
jgi:hypothetical protein